MPRTVSSSEAQNNFGAMLQWAEENKDQVVIERRGKPAAVLIGYEEYQEIERLREQERKRRAFERLEEIRRQIAARTPDLSAEEAYRLAGFSEEVIREALESDEYLASRS
jgi:prevent-host-death family protein